MSIKIKNLTHIYNEGMPFEKMALNDINIEINTGEFVGIIGHTGSGKSTLIQMFNGLLKPTKGEVLVNNENINGDKASAAASAARPPSASHLRNALMNGSMSPSSTFCALVCSSFVLRSLIS